MEKNVISDLDRGVVGDAKQAGLNISETNEKN